MLFMTFPDQKFPGLSATKSTGCTVSPPHLVGENFVNIQCLKGAGQKKAKKVNLGLFLREFYHNSNAFYRIKKSFFILILFTLPFSSYKGFDQQIEALNVI